MSQATNALSKIVFRAACVADPLLGGYSSQARVSELNNVFQADKGAATLLDPERLYVLQINGPPLSNDTVIVTLNPYSTIKQLVVDIKGKDKEGLDAIIKAIGDIDSARTAKDTPAETTTTNGEASRLAAQNARLDAELAEFKALPANATPVARKTIENKVANLKLYANQKTRKAGLALPFSDVVT